MEPWREELYHGEWKKHKYIRIENGRYIYPEDLVKGARNVGSSVANTASAVRDRIGSGVRSVARTANGVSSVARDIRTQRNMYTPSERKAIRKNIRTAAKVVGKEINFLVCLSNFLNF